MGIFDPQMLVIWHKQPQLAQSNIPVELVARIDDRSETGLNPDMLGLDWREAGDISWNHIILSSMPEPDSYYAQLPGLQEGTVIEYYFSAADSSGRQEALPRTAPEGYYLLEISDSIVGLNENPFSAALTVSALPLGDEVHIHFIPSGDGEMLVEIYDILGKKVWDTDKMVKRDEPENMVWNSGKVESGIYIIRLSLNYEVFSSKIFKR
jgi:hypothetical protein